MAIVGKNRTGHELPHKIYYVKYSCKLLIILNSENRTEGKISANTIYSGVSLMTGLPGQEETQSACVYQP